MTNCYLCGGAVEMRPLGKLEWRRVNGVRFYAPEDIRVPTCVECGESSLPPDIERSINAAIDREVTRHFSEHTKSVVERILSSHHISRKELADACGIHYTYLSKVTSGRRAPSTPLLRLLEVFDRHPDALRDYVPTAKAAPEEPKAPPARAFVSFFREHSVRIAAHSERFRVPTQDFRIAEETVRFGRVAADISAILEGLHEAYTATQGSVPPPLPPDDSFGEGLAS